MRSYSPPFFQPPLKRRRLNSISIVHEIVEAHRYMEANQAKGKLVGLT